MKEQTTRTPPKLRVLSAFLAVAMLLTLRHRLRRAILNMARVTAGRSSGNTKALAER